MKHASPLPFTKKKETKNPKVHFTANSTWSGHETKHGTGISVSHNREIRFLLRHDTELSGTKTSSYLQRSCSRNALHFCFWGERAFLSHSIALFLFLYFGTLIPVFCPTVSVFFFLDSKPRSNSNGSQWDLWFCFSLRKPQYDSKRDCIVISLLGDVITTFPRIAVLQFQTPKAIVS